MAIKSNLKAVEHELDARLGRMNVAAGITLQNHIKEQIRDEGLIDTGRYVSSITSDSDEGGAIAGTNVKRDGFSYPMALEFGTSRGIRPYAPMTKGAIKAIPDLRRIYGSGD